MSMRSLVSIVDDDESVRESLPDLLEQFGFASQAFSSAEAFLASEFVNETRCLILDIVMPGMSGLDLQRELAFALRRAGKDGGDILEHCLADFGRDADICEDRTGGQSKLGWLGIEADVGSGGELAFADGEVDWFDA